MKRTLIFSGALLATMLAAGPVASAQTSVTTTSTEGAGAATTVVTTTTRSGRVGTVTPDMVVMQAAGGTEPVPYSRTSRTVFVDETGAVVPEEVLRSGAPVTVHYSRDLDRMVAERVIVHRQGTTIPGAAVIERSTTVSPETVVVERPAATREVVVEQPARTRGPAVVEKTTRTTTTTSEPAPRRVKVETEDDDD